MNTKGRIYMKSLLAKLSAMRVTLSDEERVLLDQMILGSQAEVGAHRFVGRADESLAGGPDEVAAHKIAQGAEKAAQRFVFYYDAQLKAYQIKD